MRTLLAAERTFSAWIRTGLAGVGGGLVIVKLIPFKNVGHQKLAHIAGQLLVIWGAAIFAFSLWDYWRTYRVLGVKGLGKTPPWVLAFFSVIMFIVAVLVLLVTFRAV
jgi:putative membrane protein